MIRKEYNSAGHFNAIALGPCGFQFFKRGQQFVGHGGTLQPFGNVGVEHSGPGLSAATKIERFRKRFRFRRGFGRRENQKYEQDPVRENHRS